MIQIPTVGTISHGTLRPQDLLRALADALLDYGDEGGDAKTQLVLIAEAEEMLRRIVEDDDVLDTQATEIEEVLDGLFTELDTIAGRHGMYFGAHEGDGSDFGFWPLDE